MAAVSDISGRIRSELGDTLEPFRTSVRGDGVQEDFVLINRNVSPTSVSVFEINPDGTIRDLVVTTDYTLDAADGDIHFVVPPAPDSTIIVEGSSYGLFSDAELSNFVNDAVAQHCMDRMVTTRYRDGHGFITYDRVKMNIDNLPDSEVGLVGLLATIQTLWAMATDASTDINVQTSEGTVIPRGQRHSQLLTQIAALMDWYERLSLAMGVGIFAPEVFNLRRISRSTGRLIPLFMDREYDEHGLPTRLVPPVQDRDADPDGPVSPWWSGPGGF